MLLWLEESVKIVWAPHLLMHTYSIERVQSRALRRHHLIGGGAPEV